ncbi:MAG: site-specific integrase [Oscillospiraceae bacterium]|nr:site-specific integrase [Oscillospiraceae bacterium]
MATIQKRGDSYKITVSTGYSADGKQVRQYTTYKPNEGMTTRQIEKELQKKAVLFEMECLKGQVTATIKFEDFARQWFKEHAEIKLKKRTLANYHGLEYRIYKAIGHLRMDKITPRHIQQFILDMTNDDNRRNVSKGKLSAKTVKLHVSLISTVFSYGIKMQVVSFNPCLAVTLPKPDTKEREIYNEEETQQIINLLLKEEKQHKQLAVYCILAFFTGFRRGELCGLEWRDICFDKQIMSVNRTSNYTNVDGVFTDTPKTKSSYRTIRISSEMVGLLTHYKQFQADYAKDLGDKWIDTDRLFTAWDGEPMFPNTPIKFFAGFCKRHGIRYLNLHSCRHFAASILINAGLDVKSVQTFLGHSTPMVTLTTYCHEFRTAQTAATEALSNAINLKI